MVFQAQVEPSVVSYSSILHAYAKQGNIEAQLAPGAGGVRFVMRVAQMGLSSINGIFHDIMIISILGYLHLWKPLQKIDGIFHENQRAYRSLCGNLHMATMVIWGPCDSCCAYIYGGVHGHEVPQ